MILPGGYTNSHSYKFLFHHSLYQQNAIRLKMFYLSNGWVQMRSLKYKVMRIDLKFGQKLCQTLYVHELKYSLQQPCEVGK